VRRCVCKCPSRYILFTGTWGNAGSFPYETFTVSGLDITSAINTTAYGSCNRIYTPVIGKTYTVKFDLTLNSGALPRIFVQSSSTWGNGKEFTAVNGSNAFTWTATSNASSYFNIATNNGDATNFSVSNFNTYEGGVPDRSVKGNGLAVYGTPTVSAVATGAELKAISGFSTSNYLEQPYNSDLDFGTGDFSVILWVKYSTSSGGGYLFKRSAGSSGNYANSFSLYVGGSNFTIYVGGDTTTSSLDVDDGGWHQIGLVRTGDKIYTLEDGKYGTSGVASVSTVNISSATLHIGQSTSGGSSATNASLSLLRISATAPTAEQILEIYNAEKPLFQAGAKCMLNGSSDSVTAMSYDDSNDELLVGTGETLSVFKGLRRVDENTNSITEVAQQGGLRAEEY